MCIRYRQSRCHLPAYLAAYRAIPSIFRPHGQCGPANDNSTLLIDDISYRPPDVKSCPSPFSSQPPHIPRGHTEYGKSTAPPTCIWHRQPRSPSSRASHKTPTHFAVRRLIPSIFRPHGQCAHTNDDIAPLFAGIQRVAGSHQPPYPAVLSFIDAAHAALLLALPSPPRPICRLSNADTRYGEAGQICPFIDSSKSSSI